MSLIITILAAGNHKYSSELSRTRLVIYGGNYFMCPAPPFRFLAKKWRFDLKNALHAPLILIFGDENDCWWTSMWVCCDRCHTGIQSRGDSLVNVYFLNACGTNLLFCPQPKICQDIKKYSKTDWEWKNCAEKINYNTGIWFISQYYDKFIYQLANTFVYSTQERNKNYFDNR